MVEYFAVSLGANLYLSVMLEASTKWTSEGVVSTTITMLPSGVAVIWALYVGLDESPNIAEGHGECGGDPDQPESSGSVDGEDDPQQDGEGRGFGGGGHESDDGRGRAFVDVGGPDVKGGGGDFESEANEHQRDGDVNQHFGGGGLEFAANDVDVGGTGGSEHERDAVQEKGGGE